MTRSLLALASGLLLAGAVHAQSPATSVLAQAPGSVSGTPARGANDCTGPGALIIDDGTAENGYSGNPATINDFRVTERLTPTLAPARINTVCVCFVTLAGDNLDFQVELLDDDGAGGAPGTSLGTVNASVTGIPGGLPGAFYSVDVSSLNAVIPSGSFYVGVRYNPMNFPSRFTCADQTAATPLGNSHIFFGPTTPSYQPTVGVFPSYRAMLMRAIEAPVGVDLVTTLTDTPDPVTAGSNVTYVATVNNGGPGDATDVAVALPLAAGTNFVSATASAGGACVTPAVGANGTVTCTWAGATANGASRDVTVVASVPASTANATVLSVTATATSATTELDPPDNAATTTTTVATSADVSITITDSPDPVTAGQNLTYTVTVTNNGPSDAQAVAVSLPAPAGTTLVSGPAGPIGTLAAGASVQSTFVFAVSPAVLSGTTITGTASVTSTTTDPNAANNSATTTTAVIAEADLSVTLTASATQALINVPVTFTAVSTNGGPSDAQNVSVTITLTPDFRYSGHTATGATCTTPQIGNTGAIVCTWAGATAPGATRTLSVVAFSNVEGNTAVNASTTSATTDPVANNNAAGVTVVVGYPFNEIPTLGQFGLMLLGLLVGLMGFVAVRRQA